MNIEFDFISPEEIGEANAYREYVEGCGCAQACEYSKYDVAMTCGDYPSAVVENYFVAQHGLTADQIKYTYIFCHYLLTLRVFYQDQIRPTSQFMTRHALWEGKRNQQPKSFISYNMIFINSCFNLSLCRENIKQKTRFINTVWNENMFQVLFITCLIN